MLSSLLDRPVNFVNTWFIDKQVATSKSLIIMKHIKILIITLHEHNYVLLHNKNRLRTILQVNIKSDMSTFHRLLAISQTYSLQNTTAD